MSWGQHMVHPVSVTFFVSQLLVSSRFWSGFILFCFFLSLVSSSNPKFLGFRKPGIFFWLALSWNLLHWISFILIVSLYCLKYQKLRKPWFCLTKCMRLSYATSIRHDRRLSTRAQFSLTTSTCVVDLIYTERSDVKSWRMPVAHDSRISNGNRTECSPVRSVIIRLVRELKQRRRWRRRQRERQRGNSLRPCLHGVGDPCLVG